ncbi:hypothetical protein FRC12_017349 [Ceratobasidium sp. 428]|nr:hypothetical protein FRC12_017349 [Ceratobasidium sp. 428]
MNTLQRSPDTKTATHDQARQHLEFARNNLSESIQKYFDACQTMRAACSAFPEGLRAVSNDRERAQVAIDEELITWADRETNIQKARGMLLEARNLCKMIAPIYSLPPEILSRIFTKAICWCNKFWMDKSGPLVLASVCRQWRNLVLDNRLLWTHLDLKAYNTQPQYPNPRLWAERSGGAPISVYIRQFRSRESTTQCTSDYDDYNDDNDYDDYYEPYQSSYEDDDNNDVPASYDDHFEAPELDNLGTFIASLMQQVCSITLDINDANAAILERLLRATSGRAKVLKVMSLDQFDVLNIPSWHQRSAFYSLETLHCCNTIPPCRNWRLYNLTDLRLQVTSTKRYRSWSMSQLEFSSLLSSCPKLQYLMAEIPWFSELPSHVQKPVLLGELKVLDIKSEGLSVLESILATINPGEDSLYLSISLFESPERFQIFSFALHEFLGRSNVPMLHLRNKYIPSFASQLGSLPHVQTLSLQGWRFTDLANAGVYQGDHPVYSTTNPNPSPGPPYRTLWPQVQQLFLKYCTLEKEHVGHLISSRALQKVVLNHCHIYNETSTRLQLDSQTFDKYLGSLSRTATEIQHVTDKSETWLGPIFKLKERYRVSGVDVIKDSW